MGLYIYLVKNVILFQLLMCVYILKYIFLINLFEIGQNHFQHTVNVDQSIKLSMRNASYSVENEVDENTLFID